MLITILLAFAVFALLSAGMAIGVIMGRPPLKGSCGGLNSEGSCGLCGRPAEQTGDCQQQIKSG